MPTLAKARIGSSCISSRGDALRPALRQQFGSQQRRFVAPPPPDSGDQRVRCVARRLCADSRRRQKQAIW
jgi:hypothetical protein